MKSKIVKLPIRLKEITTGGSLTDGRPEVSRFRTMWTKVALERFGDEALSEGVTRLRTVTRVANSYNKGFRPGDAAEVTMELNGGEWWITQVTREQKRRSSFGRGRSWVRLAAADPLMTEVERSIASAINGGNPV